jgi:hypothetical protein
MCAGASLVAVLVGEERAEAPHFRVSSAHAAAVAAPSPAPVTRDEPTRAAGAGRALKLHVDSGNDDVRKNAWVYIPKAFDPKKPLHLAIVFHGFKNCIDSYVSPGGTICTPGKEQRTGYDIPAQVEKSGTGAIFVVPQLAFDQKSSDPGKLGKIGGLRRFVKELVEVALAPELGARRYEDVERVMLLASSGGYQGLLPALANGRVERVRDVYLLDAFYVDTSALTAFLREHPEDFRPDAEDPRHFGLVFCRKSGTARQSRDFGTRLGTFMESRGVGAFYAYDGWSPIPGLDDLRVPAFVYMSSLEHDRVVSEYLWKFLAVSGI